MKKHWIIIVTIVIVIASAIAGVMISRQSSNMDEYDKDILILNETNPVDIYIFGESLPFRENLLVTYVSDLATFFEESHNSKTILLLSDIDSTITLSSQTISLINYEIINNTNFDFYYLGSQYMDEFITENIFFGSVFENELCVGNVSVNGVRSVFTGIWTASDIAETDDNRDTLTYLLVRQFVRVLKENY